MTSAVTYAEVMRGCATRRLDGDAEAEAFFERRPGPALRSSRCRAYTPLPFKRGTFDRLIAAHALALGLTVVTNNERDFADVPGLKVENWTTA